MKLTIDNREVKANPGATILDVASKNDIYIPSLCAHPELTAYGGCRLCLVEIEGRKGYPTACTTYIDEGMVVRTDTNTLKELRTDLIQLILSEHPAACLICADVEGCSGYQETIRKVGITTGCRWCPKDKDCDFQKIVEYLNIKELTLPGLYRDLPLEKLDPFFDRDYNLCIYCGRCVRICSESRKSSVLSLKQRGKQTTIGPAFEASHIDADCEFCGACVSVCPTGAMSEKSRKWWGVPDGYSPSVCPLCSLNCDLQVLTLKNRVVGTIPTGKPHESGGELCVKGRFCLSEILNRTQRILEPEFCYEEGYGIVSWDIAIERAAEILKDVKPMRSAVFLSPGLTLEELAFSNRFAREVLDTILITTSCLDESMLLFMSMAQQSITMDEIKKADCLVSLFLNGNYRYAPLTLAIKNLASQGIPFFQVGWIRDTTSRFATCKPVPLPGQETESFNEFFGCLKESKYGIIVVGPEVLSLSNRMTILEEINKIVKKTHSRLLMPNPFGNLNGLLSLVDFCPFEEVAMKIEAGDIDVLYLIGDAPISERPKVNKIIYQNGFPAPADLKPDLILPAALWSESIGRYLDMFGQIKQSKAVSQPHGYAISHPEIFKKIAGKLNRKVTKTSGETIREQIKKKKSLVIHAKEYELLLSSASKGYPYVFVQEMPQHKYHSLDLSQGVEGFGELVKSDQLILHPRDAGILGIQKGDTVELVSRKTSRKFVAGIRNTISPGYLFLATSLPKMYFESNPCPVKIKKENI